MADKKVTVTLQHLAELVGMDPSAGMDAIMARADEMVEAFNARQAAEAMAASQRHLVEEDKRLVAAAVNDGRLPLSRRQFWVEALGNDRARNRALLASLAPALPPAQRIVEDESLEATHGVVLARLGLAPDKPAPVRTIAAARGGEPSLVNTAAPSYDSFGVPTGHIPNPVLLQRGTNLDEYTHQQHSDRFMHMLGGAFTRGVPRPPAGDQYYIPGPNDVSRPVVGADGQVSHWESNSDYRPQS